MYTKLPPLVMCSAPLPSCLCSACLHGDFRCCSLAVDHSRQSTNKPDCYSASVFSWRYHPGTPPPLQPFISLLSLSLSVSFPLLSSPPHPSDTSLFFAFFYVLTSQNSPACLPAATAPWGFRGMIKWRWCALQLFFFPPHPPQLYNTLSATV